ncbi:MAG: N-glycosylase/DNA lyase [Firmicutes bacterium]|nr:N-glycosylase/DNA lyase [Bacillota bacterium]
MQRKDLLASYKKRSHQIKKRLREFSKIYKQGRWKIKNGELLGVVFEPSEIKEYPDRFIFEELAFCILTAGTSARLGIKCQEKISPHLIEGSGEKIYLSLKSAGYRFPLSRAEYIIKTREFLFKECNLNLKSFIESFDDEIALRDFFASNKAVKGLGYKEASHFLRNIGLKGYAILDKHIVRSLNEVGLLKTVHPPRNRKEYLLMEEKLKKLAGELSLDFDELDLLLWSEKTGEILK